jgi:uncharacterized protein
MPAPAPFVIYLVLFHAAWTAWVLWGYPHLRALGEATLTYAAVNLTLRLLLWVAPVFLYLRLVDRRNPIDFLKLKQNWQRGVVVGITLSLLNLLGTMARFGIPHLRPGSVTWNSILGASILIGFVEEIPYRGFIWQKLGEYMSFWPATLLASLLFLGIHLPGWISLHLLRAGNVVSVFLFGMVLTMVFRLVNSLWSVIIAHSTNDFFAAVLFHL